MAPKPAAGREDTGRRVRHPLFARFYARQSESAERHIGPYRAELVAGLHGRVMDVGAGNGLNLRHYPPQVSEVVAVEPEPTLRRLARAEAGRSTVAVRVLPGVAERLPAADGEFDAAVVSLVLCSVRDVRASLTELLRVLRPGGELRFFEHGPAWTGTRAVRVQRVLDRTVWPLVFGGCHLTRDIPAALVAAGFDIEPCRRLLVPENGPRSPASYCVTGTARKPRPAGAGA